MSGFTQDDDDMLVTKRDGREEVVSFDKISKRIKKLGQEANIKVNYTALVMKVIDQLHPGIHTTKIDELSAEQCASMSSIHPDYNILAGRITISNHHKNTEESFYNVMDIINVETISTNIIESGAYQIECLFNDLKLSHNHCAHYLKLFNDNTPITFNIS